MTGESMFDLTGKVALVTGARRGIGLAMAQALARVGADIIAVSEQIESGSVVEKVVQAQGRSCRVLRCDLSKREETKRLAAQVLASGEVDILVNNAGIIKRSPAAEHSDDYWDHVLEVDLTAPFVLAREFARPMLQRGYGKIIFTASLLSFQGGINVPSYTAAKSGVVGLTKALSNEWSPRGVNVNAIAPGYIATDNTQALQDDPDRSAAILDRIPAGRWGRADDLAGATVFLASSASDYVDGIVLPVDGGWLGR